MSNQLAELGETAAWRVLVKAALLGAQQAGFEGERLPGRGLSNVWRLTKGSSTSIAAIRTTRDRWFAFQPSEEGTRWKTLDDVDAVIVAAVDNVEEPQHVEVYSFPANEVRRRFEAAYQARSNAGHNVRQGYGMWVKLDEGDISIPVNVGSGLAALFPKIASFSIKELLDASNTIVTSLDAAVLPPPEESSSRGVERPSSVADVLAWAKASISELTGVAMDAIRLEVTLVG